MCACLCACVRVFIYIYIRCTARTSVKREVIKSKKKIKNQEKSRACTRVREGERVNRVAKGAS